MILEEDTYEKFGYYPSELKPQSNRRIFTACDDCGKLRIVSKNGYSALCKSCARKGENNPNFGKHCSEETKKKIGAANKGRKQSEETRRIKSEVAIGKPHVSEEGKKRISEAKRGKHHTEDSKQKMREARKHRVFPKHHTKPELIFEDICKRNNLPFKYTGDSSFWIGEGKDVINPDFVHLTKKVVVEVFSWFHDELRNRHVQPKSRYGNRKKILKKYGWRLVVFWQDDLDREDAEARVLSVLKSIK